MGKGARTTHYADMVIGRIPQFRGIPYGRMEDISNLDDLVEVGTMRNLNRGNDIGTPEQLPSASSWIPANMGDEGSGRMGSR